MPLCTQWTQIQARLWVVRTGNRPGVIFWSICVVLLSTGCAIAPYPDPVIKPVESYELYQEIDGLKLAVVPIIDPSESQRLFKMDLLDRRILPVFVLATNSSVNSSFLIEPGQFVLINSAGEATDTGADKPDNPSRGEGAVLLIGIFAKAVGLDPEQMRANNQNFKHRELGRHTLSPGASIHGYVYFQLPAETSGSSKWMIRCRVNAPGATAEKEISFSVSSALQ